MIIKFFAHRCPLWMAGRQIYEIQTRIPSQHHPRYRGWICRQLPLRANRSKFWRLTWKYCLQRFGCMYPYLDRQTFQKVIPQIT